MLCTLCGADLMVKDPCESWMDGACAESSTGFVRCAPKHDTKMATLERPTGTGMFMLCTLMRAQSSPDGEGALRVVDGWGMC